MKIAICGVAASLVLLLAMPAVGAGSSAPKVGQRVNFCGEAGPLVEKGCIGVRSRSDGLMTIYNISTASPRPDVGEMIEGHGKLSGAMSYCMQGIPLSDVTWKKVTACPATGGK